MIKTRTVKLLAALLAIALILSITGPAFAAAPENNPGKGPPTLERIVLIHHAKDFPAGNPHGTPPGQDKEKPGGDKDEGGKLWFKTNGWHWVSMPVPYRVTNSMPADFLNTIQDSFAAWDDASESFSVNYLGSTDVLPDTLIYNEVYDDYYPDMKNVVGWKNLGASDAIGITYMWVDLGTMELVDVDTALNSNSAYHWWQNTSETSWTEGSDPYAYDVDFQNIMTHEAGHWLCLDDLYQKPAGQQTMYGISTEFELKKRSLESGDIAGIQEIYPDP